VTTARDKPRVRWTLLVLLWIWVVVVFLTLDLFLNVNGLDGVRPRAKLYRGMRVAAHKLVGEPIVDLDHGNIHGVARNRDVPGRPPTDAAGTLAAELAGVRAAADSEYLRDRATQAEDPRVRIAALRQLAERIGRPARATLMAVVFDDAEIFKVRKQAARFLGRTGNGASGELERVLDTELPRPVRAGAILGLGELGHAAGAERLLEYSANPNSIFRTDAVSAIARLATREAAPFLREAALQTDRDAETREAACRALGRIDELASARVLAEVLADPDAPPAVRATAANSLGRLGRREALPAVMAARSDSAPGVARQARLAASRLSHVGSAQSPTRTRKG